MFAHLLMAHSWERLRTTRAGQEFDEATGQDARRVNDELLRQIHREELRDVRDVQGYIWQTKKSIDFAAVQSIHLLSALTCTHAEH